MKGGRYGQQSGREGKHRGHGGHLLRNNAWVISMVERKPGRGRPRQACMKQIVMLDLGNESYKELKEVSMYREKWRNVSLMNQFTD